MRQAIAVLGAGAWGTALALAFARAGAEVALWSRDESRMAEMAATRTGGPVLPGIALEPSIRPTADLAEAVRDPVLVLAVPTQALWEVCGDILALGDMPRTMISASKGIERGSGRFVTEVMDAEMLDGHSFGILSGPSFAADVAKGLPTAVTLAMYDGDEAERLANRLSSTSFRLYHSSDVRGVEIGGAAKNVLAIAAGIVIGLGLGESARAALIARGFAELRRFAEAHGARPETLMGLSGLGDLVLTASSMQSRNFSLGFRLGQGMPLAEAAGGKLAEGAFTAPVLAEMARKAGVEMPIAAAVAAVLDGALSVKEAVQALVSRPVRGE